MSAQATGPVTSPATDTKPLCRRLVLLASDGYQSLVTLQTLLAHGCRPAAIALAGGSPAPITTALGGIPLHTAARGDSLEALALQHRIPLLDGDPDALLAQLSQQPPPALLLSSCYPHRLPDALLQLPEHGCFNLHPSALPQYRGPSPIFWQLRDGLRDGAVSVHRMTAQLDSGGLLLQLRQPIADGSDYAERVRQLTQSAVSALLQRLPDWLAGSISLTPQQGEASYQGWPQRNDFMLAPDWSARHSYNFIRGSAALGRALVQLDGGGLVEVERVLHYQPADDHATALPRQQLPEPGPAPGQLLLQDHSGRLTLAVHPASPPNLPQESP